MLALRLLDWTSDPELVDVALPHPSSGEVVVKVGGAGVCHTDLHLIRNAHGNQMPWTPPFTLGHENAGWVHDLGAGVTGFEVGQPVAVYGSWGCGTCRQCRLGAETLCENLAGAPVRGGGGGLGMDGGMAEYMLVPAARHLVPLPTGLNPLVAAPLTDAGLTPYRAVRRSLGKLPPGSTAVVVGVGGLGDLAVQILRALTAARVVAVDLRTVALKQAASRGADLTLLADGECAAAIRSYTGGLGADVVLDFVGSDSSLALSASVARIQGDLTIVGLGGTLPVNYGSVPKELSIQRSSWGSRPELVEVLELAARNLIAPTITTFPLADGLSAYQQLEAGTLVGRGVIVPG